MEEDDNKRIAMYSTIEPGGAICIHIDKMIYDLVSICRAHGMPKAAFLEGASVAWDDEDHHLVMNIPDNLKN